MSGPVYLSTLYDPLALGSVYLNVHCASSLPAGSKPIKDPLRFPMFTVEGNHLSQVLLEILSEILQEMLLKATLTGYQV